MDPDVVVGGGIAGSALATVLAREGLAVTVLERQHRYTDQVRGENLHPWGVAEAQRLGFAAVLLVAGHTWRESSSIMARPVTRATSNPNRPCSEARGGRGRGTQPRPPGCLRGTGFHRGRRRCGGPSRGHPAFGPGARERRRRVEERCQQHPELMSALVGILTGPEATDPQVYTPEFARRYVGADRPDGGRVASLAGGCTCP